MLTLRSHLNGTWIEPTEAGTIYVRARSLNAESLGEYTLLVRAGRPPADEPSEGRPEPSHH